MQDNSQNGENPTQSEAINSQSMISHFCGVVRELPVDFLPAVTQARIQHLRTVYF